MTTLTLQPSNLDTWMNKNSPNNTADTNDTMYLNGDTTYNYRPLVRFDLSSLPSTAIVTTATMYLYCLGVSNSGASLTVNAYRVLRNWTGSCTWNKYDGTNAWTTGGCDSTSTDRSATAIASTSFSDVGWTTYTLSLAEFGYIRSSNYGMVLIPQNSASDKWLASNNYTTDTTKQPKLVIDYTFAKAKAGVAVGPYMIF